MNPPPSSTRPPTIVRRAARVLLFDPLDRVLLIHCQDPTGDRGRFWITPGGGVDEGETHEQAAARELNEELGLSDIAIGPCVWRRRHQFTYRHRRYDQRERFYVARTPITDLSLAGLSHEELNDLLSLRWWSAEQLAAARDEVFAPRRIAALLPPVIAGEMPAEPIDVGV